MRSILKRLPRRHGTVVAYVALFAALGGSAYAVVTVTGKTIRNGTITGKDVRDRSLDTQELSANAVTSLTGQRGPAGPRGEQGEPGLDRSQPVSPVRRALRVRPDPRARAGSAAGSTRSRPGWRSRRLRELGAGRLPRRQAGARRGRERHVLRHAARQQRARRTRETAGWSSTRTATPRRGPSTPGSSAPRSGEAMSALGPIGRLGRLAAKHRGRVFAAWALIAVGLGILAPRVETALSGAGWQANGSESVEAREQIDRNFAGAGSYALQVVVHSRDLVATAPEFRQTVARSERVLRHDPAVGRVFPPQPGLSISPDGHTAVIRAGAAADPNAMVDAADRLEDQACRRRRPRSCRQPDRRLGDVVGLQRGEPRGDAQVRAHLLAGDDGDPGAGLRLAGGRGSAADADHRRA